MRRILLMFLLLVGTPATAAEVALQVGLASANITPTEPVMLAGYASRTEPYSEVLDELQVKALAAADAAGTRVVLITADLIGFVADVADPIRQRVSDQTGIHRDHIVINGSHTHTAPALMLERKEGSTLTEDQAGKSIAYTRRVQEACVRVAVEAVSKLQPAKLAVGAGVIHFPMNRREFTANGVILGVNPRGLVDRGVQVLRIEDAQQKLIGVVLRASCHNTTFGGSNNQVSGDFAGAAQQLLESALPGTTVLFMQSLAGDTNPYPNSLNDPGKRPAAEIARAHGAELSAEVRRVLQGKLKPVAGPIRAQAGVALLPLQPRPGVAELEQQAGASGSWKKWALGHLLADAKAGRPALTQYPAPLAVWQFGTDLTMVHLSGEVVIDYAPAIEQAVGPLQLWLTAYCQDTFGYIPSARVLREGGYETRGLYHGGVGFFAPEAEAVLVGKVRELVTAARQSH